MKDAQYIKGLPLFDGLTCDEAQKVGFAVIERYYQEKQMVFSDNEKVEYVYLIREGRVKLFRQTEDGRENIIAILGPGDVFGDFIFGEDSCHTMFAEAFGSASLCFLPHKKFMQMLMEYPGIALKIIRNIGKRLSQTAYFIENLSTYNIKVRFGKLLLYLASEHRDTAAANAVLEIKLTHQDMASMVATCRQTITELVGQFKQEGFVSYQGRQLVVHHSNLSAWLDSQSVDSQKRASRLGGRDCVVS